MLITDMELFFDCVVNNYLKTIEKKFLDYKKYYRVKNKPNDIKKLHKYYQKERKKVYCYMSNSCVALDGHKVAACFIYSLLKHKLIKVNKFKKKLPIELLMSNEYLACTVAMNIVSMYYRTIHKDSKFELCVPKTNHDTKEDTSDFIPNLCKALYYLRSSSRFDVFAYSSILFLLEKYTDVINKLNEKS